MGATISHLLGGTFPTLDWKGLQWAIVESPTFTGLLKIGGEEAFGPSKFASGLAFGDTRELRWRECRGGTFHLVEIREDGSALNEETERSLTELFRETIRLWGNGQWHEARIPAVLKYPAEFAGSAIGVELIHYELTGEAEPVFLYRCKRLVGVAH